MTSLATGPIAAADPFRCGAPVLVGDPTDPIVFVALAAAQVDATRLERVQRLAGGMTVLGLDDDRVAGLGLAPLPGGRRELGLALAAPVDAAHGVSGGWSASDRAHTMRVCADPASHAADLSAPGHVHPAHVPATATPAAAAAIELAREATGTGAVVLGAVTGSDGVPVALSEARATIALRRLPHYASTPPRADALHRSVGGRTIECALPTDAGLFRAVVLDDAAAHDSDRGATVALVHGDPGRDGVAPVHIHSACLLGDAFGSLACDCRAQLHTARERILAAGAGVIVYVKPGRPDEARRYHCGRETAIDLAPVHALLRACGVADHSDFTRPS